MAINALAATGALKLFEGMVDDIYQTVKSKLSKELLIYESKETISKIYENINNVRLVKTLWQIDKPIDLGEFYCDPHVVDGKTRRKIYKIDDFDLSKNILVEGIAGQGKSIFLRYLCAKELEYCTRIPIFIELRRLENNDTIYKYTKLNLETLGFKTDDIILEHLLSSGKMILLLDAFDELKSSLAERIITEIEHMSSKYKKIRFIVTTRKDSKILHSPFFKAIKLDNIKGNEYKALIKKLCPDKVISTKLIENIESGRELIKGVLCTPLMITLLILTYKAYQQIPENLSGFYDLLFDLLLKRHDGTKPGFSRERRSKLNDIQYRQAFEALSYLTKKENSSSFDFRTLYNYSEKALKSIESKEDPQKFLEDIIIITCLILKEGDDLRFIHKSVHEYYAASFIKNRPEAWAKEFYCNVKQNIFKWAQELRFLNEIDRYKFYKYLLLPIYLDILRIDIQDLRNEIPDPDSSDIERLIGGIKFSFRNAGNKGFTLAFIQLGYGEGNLFIDTLLLLEQIDIFDEIVKADFSDLQRDLNLKKFTAYELSELPEFLKKDEKEDSTITIKLSNLIKSGYNVDFFESMAKKVFKYIFNKSNQMHDYIKKQDSYDFFGI